VPLRDEQRRILKWYGTLTNIEDRKLAEEALRKSQAELAHVSRVTTMGELTASIAHEVNQPLAAVVNNANACISLLSAGDPDFEDVREALAEIVDDAERASAVIARVRQLAKRAPIEKSLLDLSDVVQGPGAGSLRVGGAQGYDPHRLVEGLALRLRRSRATSAGFAQPHHQWNGCDE
jgi:hypothetical protein